MVNQTETPPRKIADSLPGLFFRNNPNENIPVLRTFQNETKAAEPQNICRNENNRIRTKVLMVLNNSGNIPLQLTFPFFFNQGITVSHCKNQMEIKLGVCIRHCVIFYISVLCTFINLQPKFCDKYFGALHLQKFTTKILLQIFRCAAALIIYRQISATTNI
jgi:hypothetical protein